MTVQTSRSEALRWITEADLCRWIAQARPGDVLEYHRGFLANDVDSKVSALSPRARSDVRALARRARWAAEHRLVCLVQVRLDTDTFSYRAIARHKPKSGRAAWARVLDPTVRPQPDIIA